VEIGNERKHVISYLEDFLFPPQRSRSPVKSLSGGERNRLLLARLFARPSNVLVLDEPTNDLDIDTLELLESLLQDFPGTLFLVSHDRAFLENTVTQVIAFEGNGQLTEFGGGYDDWLRFTEQRASVISNIPKTKASEQKQGAASIKPSKAKLNYKEQLELAELPEKIEKIESEIAAINNTLADPAIYKADLEKATALQIKLTEFDESLFNTIARWEELESKNAE